MKKRSKLRIFIISIFLIIIMIAYLLLQIKVEGVDWFICLYKTINLVIKKLWELLLNPIVLVTIIVLFIFGKRNSFIKLLSEWVSELKIGPVSAKFGKENIISGIESTPLATLTEEEKSISLELIDNISEEICRILLRMDGKAIFIDKLPKIVAEETIKAGVIDPKLSVSDENFCLGLLGGIFRVFNNIWFDVDVNDDEKELKLNLYPNVKEKIVARVYATDKDDQKSQ